MVDYCVPQMFPTKMQSMGWRAVRAGWLVASHSRSRWLKRATACRDYITLSGQARTGAHCPSRNEMSYETFLVEK